ncbi:MAG: hypothetical protein LBL83_03125 [Clostridiales bacterium]|jgi:hypothetical protein|nr:hypothetical protein [Clostridiales bacterium]
MAAAIAAAALLASGCAALGGQLDVVGKESVAAFGNVLDAAPGNVSRDEAIGGWALAAPDGSARFAWSENYSNSPSCDIMLALDAQPFIDAGLDTDLLPAGNLPSGSLPDGGISFDGSSILVGAKLGDEAPKYDGEPTPLDAFGQIAALHGGAIGFHAAMDHFNVDLGGGNMFEWAKDMAANTQTGENQDKDIVFVLDPEPFIMAGADPGAIEGWAFSKVQVGMGANAAEVDKLLKPFDLGG